jgi:hypothetical protein
MLAIDIVCRGSLRLQQLCGDGYGNGCGQFAVDAIDADRADEAADAIVAHALIAQSGAETRALALRADYAYPRLVFAL